MDAAKAMRVESQLSEERASALALDPDEVANGLAAIEETYRRPTSPASVSPTGFGINETVEHEALEVHDGIGPYRGTR